LKAILDGDIITFRAAFSAEDETEEWVANARADKIIDDILVETGSDSFEVWLSGQNNFRYSVFPEYKVGRRDTPRPKWEHQVKDHLTKKWFALWSEGCEADDMLGIRATELGDDSIIVTIDKDLKQIPGKHYNFVKKEHFTVSEADGFRFFCWQLIVGDPTDGIKGILGMGPKKADALLEANPPEEWLSLIEERYSCWEEMDMNAQCLYIHRKKGDSWKHLATNELD
jgi:DNA polymerase-1